MQTPDRRPHVSPGHDESLLETDVMRFLAILAICLMAIFALIQAIPVSEPDAAVGIQSAENLAAELSRVRARLDKARSAASALEDEIAAALEVIARQRIEQTRLDAALRTGERALADLKRDYGKLAARTRAVESRLAERTSRLRDLDTRIAAGSESLAALERRIRRAARTAERAETELASIARALEPASPADAPPGPESRTATVEPSPPDEDGGEAQPADAGAFSLRFDSTQALIDLVRAGRTTLYVEAGSQIWRARRGGGFEPAPPPYKPFELTDDPGDVLTDSFRRSSGLIATNSLRWLVKFDAGMSGELRERMASAPRGDLVIRADGSVTFE